MKPLALWAIFLLLHFTTLIYCETYFKLPSHQEIIPPIVLQESKIKLAKNVGIIPELPPIGMSSLTFVFDRTGSMNDDLNQVRQGAKGIFETVMKQRHRFIYNYVLVLFHDPGLLFILVMHIKIFKIINHNFF